MSQSRCVFGVCFEWFVWGCVVVCFGFWVFFVGFALFFVWLVLHFSWCLCVFGGLCFAVFCCVCSVVLFFV